MKAFGADDIFLNYEYNQHNVTVKISRRDSYNYCSMKTNIHKQRNIDSNNNNHFIVLVW